MSDLAVAAYVARDKSTLTWPHGEHRGWKRIDGWIFCVVDGERLYRGTLPATPELKMAVAEWFNVCDEGQRRRANPIVLQADMEGF